MLVKGNIPETEPTVSIGLVMPVDRQGSVIIENSADGKVYHIESKNEHIIIDDKSLPSIELKNNSSDSHFIISPITAGRGFHWEKEISVKVLGNLTVSNKDGFLFVVNNIHLEMYLMCVATSEMSGECPPALLEAQTIAARSWLVAAVEQKHADLGLDACNDDCCQRYQGIGNLTNAAHSATEKTCGQFLMYNNEICDTRYSKSCGGISEHNENVWYTDPKPYLRGIFDGNQEEIPNLSDTQNLKDWVSNYPDCYCGNNYIGRDILKKYLGNVDEKENYFRWEFTYSQDVLKQMINEKTGISFELISSLQSLKRGISGRIIQLQINGISKNEPFKIVLESEYEIRRVLHPDFLYSSAFIIIANSDTEPALSEITLKGAGWGHGVGLCQIGALGMALEGKSSKQILSHYFLSTGLKKLYD